MSTELSDPQRRALLWLAERVDGPRPTEKVLRGLRLRGLTVQPTLTNGARPWRLTRDGRAVVDELARYLDRTTVATTGKPWFYDDPRRACRDADPTWFFPKAGGKGLASRGKALCRSCPLLADCLEYALPITDLHGIWAGLNRFERKAIREGAAPMPTYARAAA